jgi:hypothetical protein
MTWQQQAEVVTRQICRPRERVEQPTGWGVIALGG